MERACGGLSESPELALELRSSSLKGLAGGTAFIAGSRGSVVNATHARRGGAAAEQRQAQLRLLGGQRCGGDSFEVYLLAKVCAGEGRAGGGRREWFARRKAHQPARTARR